MVSEKEKKYQEQFIQAIKKIRELKTVLEEKNNLSNSKEKEPVAIIGIGCRYPGGIVDLSTFWDVLKNSVNAITDIPNSRWDQEKFYDSNPATKGKTYLKKGGFIDNIESFDNTFFDISPREASYMDPHQRILLEVVYEAIEDSGIKVSDLFESNTSVHIGQTTDGYEERHLKSGSVEDIDIYSVTGFLKAATAGRISYQLGLQGAAITHDTACSSSLVAIHLACQGLNNYESDLAIAGGVNIITSPVCHIALSQMQALSADGHCKTFDASANGFTRGDGCGVLILKRLSEAQRDNDKIYGIIKGSAVNQDGQSNGFTAPNGLAQEKVINTALSNARVSSSQIDYVEAHGTGTPLGDPIEMEAINNCYGGKRNGEGPLYVGSVKSNFGHTEGAAGVAGIIKGILALNNKQIPSSLHFNKPNPHIPWGAMKVKVPTELVDWNKDEGLRAFAVSSFGISGTNSHIIVEEFKKPKQLNFEYDTNIDFQALFLSAKTPEGLKDYASKFVSLLNNEENHVSLERICSNALYHKSHFTYRETFIGENVDSIVSKLSAFIKESKEDLTFIPGEISKYKVVFVFPGQGSQWLGMGRDLYKKEPAFKESIDSIENVFNNYVEWSLSQELLYSKSDSNFEKIDVIQPVLVAVQISLANLWQSYGIQPDAVVGHSMGEVAAAYISGAISLDQAAQIICTRSKLMNEISGKGGMAVTELSVNEAEKIINGHEDKISIAVNNSPVSTVLSGDISTLNNVVNNLEKDNVFARLIKVNVASHSPQTDSLKENLKEELKTILPSKEKIPFYSTVKGNKISGTELNNKYWVKNLRNPVLYAETVSNLLDNEYNIFIEVSPHPVLKIQTEQNIETKRGKAVVIPTIYRDRNEKEYFLTNFTKLYSIGYPIDWGKLYQYNTTEITSLPSYPWQHKSFWLKDNFENYASLSIDEVSNYQNKEEKKPGKKEEKKLIEVLNEEQEEKKKQGLVKEFLKAQVASVSGFSTTEIDENKNFSSMGIDSMMILQIRKKIESIIGVSTSVKDFIMHSSIDKISNFLLKNFSNSTISQNYKLSETNKWLYIPKPNKNAKYRLYCFHGSAESATMFHSWLPFIGDEIELIAIQLPGRGDRIMENCYTNLNDLIEDIIKNIHFGNNKPFAFFGHSMGGIILHEIVIALRSRNYQLPEKIFISATVSPKKIKNRDIILNKLPEKALIAFFPNMDKKLFDDEEFYQIMLNTLRMDLKLMESYKYNQNQEILDIPIVAFRAKNDNIVSKKEITGWRNITTNEFQLFKRKGNHNYISGDTEFIVNTIKEQWN